MRFSEVSEQANPVDKMTLLNKMAGMKIEFIINNTLLSNLIKDKKVSSRLIHVIIAG